MTTYQFETPCLVANFSIVKRNIRKMQDLCNRYGCLLRPHIKTHKSVEIARMQVNAGAVGITCAKVSEAEVMAEGGLLDIFIAYPIIGQVKIDRAMALAKKVKRLILAVDSFEGARAISGAAKKHGQDVEIRLEIDTGAKRTGVPMQEAALLAAKIANLPNLRLTGLYTFKSMFHNSLPTTDSREAAKEECELLDQVKKTLALQGISILDLSAGSTPTGPDCAATGLVNEIRPGTYVFNDQMCLQNNACGPEDIAARIIATVVSAPAPEYAVIDGGSKTFPTDIALNKEPLNLHSYGYVKGRGNLRLDRVNEEHGMIRTDDGSPTGLNVGDILELIPAHICTAVNLQNHIYVEEGGTVRKLSVDARGKLV